MPEWLFFVRQERNFSVGQKRYDYVHLRERLVLPDGKRVWRIPASKSMLFGTKLEFWVL